MYGVLESFSSPLIVDPMNPSRRTSSSLTLTSPLPLFTKDSRIIHKNGLLFLIKGVKVSTFPVSESLTERVLVCRLDPKFGSRRVGVSDS